MKPVSAAAIARCGTILWSTMLLGVAIAGSTTYEYNELGRLIKVVRDGVVVDYEYDLAGNRSAQVSNVAQTPGVPPSISVPSSSGTGSYTISWSASTGDVTAYQLYEATNPSFSDQVQVYSGTGTSNGLSGRTEGTYYYRVRACDGTACSDYRTDSNGIQVRLPPSVPPSITVPSSSSTGSYTISWGASAGTVIAYHLYEATNSSFSEPVQVYNGTETSVGLSGRADGKYYYRVLACNWTGCSGSRTGSNGITVTTPPSVPASISVPANSNTGSYTISWGSSTGNVTVYQLYEATNARFSNPVEAFNGNGTSASLTGRLNGTYYYQVRACNGDVCSDYRTGSNGTTVTLPPSDPPSISVPSASNAGNYTISWGGSTGNVTDYQLYEATNTSFSGQVPVYSGTGTSVALLGEVSGTYYYRVRACNGAACSAYRTGNNAIAVTAPPSVPASISVPASSSTGSYTISWGASTGNVTYYQLVQATDSSFSDAVQVYSEAEPSVALSGRTNGTYYYRVRACNGAVCSAYRAGSNGTTVKFPPSVPNGISVPASSSTGNYTISWGASTGNVTAYQLYEATDSSFSSQVLVYGGTGTSAALSGRSLGTTYYYRVHACDGTTCSGYRASSGITVAPPPSIPPWISGPSSSTTGSYTINWGISTGEVTAYQLYEATNSGFSDQVQVYSGTGTGVVLAGRVDGTYYYRVRACNGSACSGYRAGTNNLAVKLPPSAPASISVPSSSTSGNYTISWGASTGTAPAYQLYEATNPSFSGQVQVYDGTGVSTAFSDRADGTYYYRVRACNSSGCGGYQTGGNGTTVTSPITAISPTSQTFGVRKVNTTSAAESIDVTNVGTAPLTVNNVTLGGAHPGQFAIASNGCTSPILPGNSCAVGVTFTPTDIGTKSANLTVTSDARNGPVAATFSGIGKVHITRLTASRSSVSPGTATRLVWKSTGAATCSGSGDSNPASLWNGDKAKNGSLDFRPINLPGTYSLTLTCTDALGRTDARSVTYTVTLP